jgi:two-component system response regulator
MSQSAPIDVLLVEDDPADVFMVKEALTGWSVPTSLHVAQDGVEATAFLRREGEHCNAPRPALVLLDLNMPRKDGFEVLIEVKGDRDLAEIPIVVFTTSDTPEDVTRSYAERANAYVVKPINYDDFARVVREIDHFYTQVAKRPTPPAG